MAPWLNRVVFGYPRDGTATTAVNPASTANVVGGAPFTPTAERMLVATFYGGVTSTPPANWLIPANHSAVNYGGLYVWYRVAAGGDTFTLSHNGANYYRWVEVFEFPAGSTFLASASAVGVPSGNPGPTVTLPEGAKTAIGLLGINIGGSEVSVSTSWEPGTTLANYSQPTAATDGVVYSSGYVETTATSQSMTATYTNSSAGMGNSERLIIGVSVPAAPSTTSVTASRATTWAAASRVSAQRAASWAANARVSAARQAAWAALARVSQQRPTSWAARAAVAATRATTWAARATVSGTRSASWETRAAATSSRAASWATRAAVTATRAASWTAAARVAAQRVTSWATRAAASAARSASWDLRSTVTSSRSTPWAAKATVTATRSTTWAAEAGPATFDTYTDDYGNAPLTQVTASRSASWVVRRAVSANRPAVWQTLTRVGPQTRSTGWATRQRVTPQQRTALWALHARSTATCSTRWATFGRVSGTRVALWTVRTTDSVTSSRPASWAVLVSVTGSRRATWRIVPIVPRYTYRPTGPPAYRPSAPD